MAQKYETSWDLVKRCIGPDALISYEEIKGKEILIEWEIKERNGAISQGTIDAYYCKTCKGYFLGVAPRAHLFGRECESCHTRL